MATDNTSEDRLIAEGNEHHSLENPLPRDVEILHAAQVKLLEELRALGIVDVIEEVTGRKMPTMEDIYHRENSESDLTSYLHPSLSPQKGFGDKIPHEHDRAWGIKVLGIIFSEEIYPTIKTVVKAEDRYLPTKDRENTGIIRFRFSLAYPMRPQILTDIATLSYGGNGIYIRGENMTMSLSSLPENPQERAHLVTESLINALTHSERVENNFLPSRLQPR